MTTDRGDHEGSPTRRLDPAIADHLNDAIVVFDDRRRPMEFNAAATRLFRVSDDDPVGDVADLVAADERGTFVAAVDACTPEDAWSGSVTVHSPLTGPIPTRSTLCRVDDGQGPAALVWIARDVTTERAIVQSLRERAFYDRATGLPHRSLFLDRLDLVLRDGDPSASVAVVAVTPDRFRSKLSRFATARGPVGLRQVAAHLTAAVGENASVHRWADENFVILLEGADEAAARDLARTVRDSFVDPVTIADTDVYFTLSIGIATAHAGSGTTDDLLRRTESALQLSRQTEGSEITVFDDVLAARAARTAQLEGALGHAAERGEFHLRFQPEVDLRTGGLVACEALLRWEHPEWGQISPAEFIPVAETSDTIIEVGTWVLEAAMRQSAQWRREFPSRADLTIAVNISARQFADDHFVPTVEALLASTGADPSVLCLEITESMLVDDVEETVRKLGHLHDLGLRIAVDDFGTGYSSLSYLRRFPVDILKVDRTFVSGLGHDAEDSAIVQAVVRMGQALGLRTVAEGVETAHHVIELRELQCDLAQGFHYSPPVEAERFATFLAAGDDWLDIARDG